MNARRIRLKRYREWSLTSKLIVITGLLLFLSVFIESYLLYTQYTRDFQRQSSAKVQQIIDQVALNIDTYLDDLYRLTISPYRNAGIMTALEEPPPRTELGQLEKRRLIENYLDEMMIYPREDILRVSIVTDRIYSSARLPTKLVPDERLEDYDWYKQALASQEYIFVSARENEFRLGGGNVEVFSVVKQLRSIRNTQTILGVIKADANYDAIVDIVERADMGRGGGLFIVDEHREFIFASNDAHKRTALTALQSGGPVAPDYLVNSSYIPRTNWHIVAVNSVAEMNREAIRTRNQALLLSIGSALGFILLLILFLRHFLKPLLAIVSLMKKAELGMLDVTFRSERKDEIGYLGAAFNRLVKRIDEMLQENTALVREVYESKLLQQEAQINALFSQIQPHFIFNTLNLISLSMQSGQQDKAIQNINGLSKILRSMSQWDKEIPLRKELDLLHAYLGIQCSRYEGRLAYRIEIDPALHEVPIPALLLQPLVENAVKHGCERKKGLTTIVVAAAEAAGDERIVFEVTDDGPGVASETLRRLRRTLGGDDPRPDGRGEKAAQALLDGYDENGAGIGLANVNKRIQARYGADYGLHIDGAEGTGVTVRLEMPYPSRRADDV
ncbi:cache domain-containing sensor histidine kinase [Paenibacillus sp.]|uniref:cache domain-containing sensor histidine kinase n=1 Tax=Paenibacillus sp. TaxID=58172 RepID=UPI002D3818A2|nr:histidine kinase [Paenibacillus sp.]HZG56363.1 histidine kinase [Paenibacillus sp.]